VEGVLEETIHIICAGWEEPLESRTEYYPSKLSHKICIYTGRGLFRKKRKGQKKGERIIPPYMGEPELFVRRKVNMSAQLFII